MFTSPYRVASTWLRNASNVSNEELARSFQSLAKRNSGFWKSERQGFFLQKQADNLMRMPANRDDAKAALKWANSLGIDVDGGIPLTLRLHLKQFGHHDISKIRVYALFVLLDPYGVVAIDKVKIEHARANREVNNWPILPQTAKRTYRRRGRVGPVFAPFKEQAAAKEDARAAQIEKNQELIKKIESLPEYYDRDILQSFVGQLEEGRTLSPRQKDILIKFMDKPEDVGIGDKASWQASLENVGRLVAEKIIEPMAIAEDRLEEELQRGNDLGQELRDFWDAWRRGEKTETMYISSRIAPLLDKLVNANLQTFYTSYYDDLRDQTLRAIKTKRKVTKKAMKFIVALKQIEKDLENASMAKVQAIIDDLYGF